MGAVVPRREVGFGRFQPLGLGASMSALQKGRYYVSITKAISY